MKLTVKDRLIIPMLFDKESNYITIALQRDIAKKVEMSQDEMKAVNMRNGATPDTVVWDEPAEPFEIAFTEAELTHLAKLSRRADSENKVTTENFDTIRLFLKGE